MSNGENGLNPAERQLNKKLNVHAWIATIVTILSVLVATVIVYGKAIVGLEVNAREHKQFTIADSLSTVKIEKVIRNQDVMYYNLLQMAKRLNMQLTKEEEIFLNSYKQNNNK